MRVLYLGTDPSRYVHVGELVHYPVIRTILRVALDEDLQREMAKCTHFLFTSPNAVRHWFSIFSSVNVRNSSARFFAIGSSTAAALVALGIGAVVAPVATQEGMIELLETLDLRNALVGWPRSSRARSVLADYLKRKEIAFLGIDLYETIAQKLDPVPDLRTFDEIVFTSPSTVDAFLEIFGAIPWEKKIVSLGPITMDRLYSFRLNGTQKDDIQSL
jgi:uroporphyrinogen-III synthase